MIELMWGLVNMAYVRLPLLIKRLSSYIKTLVVCMMLFSFFFVRRRNSSPVYCPQFKSNEQVS